MLSFINFKNYPEKLEIQGNKDGFIELIKILENVINTKEHYHLIEGNEIDEYKIKFEDVEGLTSVKSITIEYINDN